MKCFTNYTLITRMICPENSEDVHLVTYKYPDYVVRLDSIHVSRCGDTDGDNDVDTDDSIAVYNYINSGGSLVSLWSGNVNGDGDIDIDDLVRYKEYFDPKLKVVLDCEYVNPWGPEQFKIEELQKSCPIRILSIVPNPSRTGFRISYTVNQASEISMDIYDLSGRCVNHIIKRIHQPGTHYAIWDGCDMGGLRVPAGIYFCKLQSPDYQDVKKISLLQ